MDQINMDNINDKNPSSVVCKSIYEIDYNNSIVKIFLPNLSDYIQKTIFTSQNFYESEMLADIKSRSIEKMVVIDAGANIGNHTLFFSKICNANRVYSFEPQKEIYEILKKNIVINNLDNKVCTYNIALGSNKSTGTLYDINKLNFGKTKLKIDLDCGKTVVDTIDSLIYHLEPKIHIIKIDVEGMELDVLKGAKKVLARDKPLLYIEAFNSTAYNNITSYLSSFGYKSISCFNKTPTYLYQANIK